MAVYYPPYGDASKRVQNQNADMHAGNEKTPEPVRDESTEKIDWEAHRRFMRGL